MYGERLMVADSTAGERGGTLSSNGLRNLLSLRGVAGVEGAAGTATELRPSGSQLNSHQILLLRAQGV